MSQTPPSLLPKIFRDWFESRGWEPRAHQLDLLAKAREGRSVLLVAPTGAGKTLAGFLPSLVELSERGPGRGTAKDKRGLHTLYISPLKALATDVARNLETPVAEMGLPVRIETRTGDTPSHKRARQIERPPDILLTTPEQLALLLAHAEARDLLQGPAPGGARRAAFPRHLEARRSAVAGLGTADDDRPAGDRRGALGDGARAGRSEALSGAAAADRFPPPCGGDALEERGG